MNEITEATLKIYEVVKLQQEIIDELLPLTLQHLNVSNQERILEKIENVKEKTKSEKSINSTYES